MFRGGKITRRTVLQGLGTTMALPFLEAMLPRSLAMAGGAASSATAPRRMAVIYVPNGVNMQHWTPTAEGANFELPAILEPLAPHRQDLMVLSGLTADKARPNGDGPGDHARAASAFLTGCQARKNGGSNIQAGVSADQVAASRIGERTRLPSLELGMERYRGAGACDSGYACAYSTTIAWRTARTPLPVETDPRQVFERLFSARPNDPDRVRRNRLRSSVLDSVLEDARDLQNIVGGADRQRLDEYLTGIRELEQRIARSESLPPIQVPAGTTMPQSMPSNLTAHFRLMCDLLALAFQTDVTRVSTFMFAKEGSNQSYNMVGVSEGHHELSHHQNNQANLTKIRAINRFHIEQFAYLLQKLRSVREGNGTLLDNCMISYGSAIGDGNRHNHDNLPILLVGKGGGSLRSGRHIRFRRETPLNNLWLAMLDRMGAPTQQLGDSTGILEGLS
jgi:hypothetical protein